MIAKGEKYAAYKSIKTKLVKAYGQSNGLTSVGNDYDEYVDQSYYYFIDLKTRDVWGFDLKKKSMRDAFGSVKDKVDEYLNEHKHDEIDDKFLEGLVKYLNS